LAIDEARFPVPKMQRRRFILLAGGAVAWPLKTFAQQSSGKIWRVAYLYPENFDNPADRNVFDAFRAELRQLGYIEGKNLVIDVWLAQGKIDRLQSLVSEAIALKPDVIVGVATPSVVAARHATSTIPIVMSPGSDPVRAGLITSLAHPGGNITGISDLNDEALSKLVELLHVVVPAAKRMAVLMSSNPSHLWRYGLTEAAAKTLGLTTVQIVALTPADLEQAFDSMVQEKCDALVVLPDATRPAIVPLAAKAKIPAFFSLATYVALGGLASYGANPEALFRKTAQYVGKIFLGAVPAELPVEQPVTFDLTLNLKTAAALGLSVPDSVLARADKVIE
jgi:putative ABC transport system substrate-binding protein